MLGKGLASGLGSANPRLVSDVRTRADASVSSQTNVSRLHQASGAASQEGRDFTFPGATGPGTGARHYPALKADTLRPLKGKERKEIFELKTTKDYYKEFPGLVRSSFPLYIKSAGIQEPLGKLEKALQDAGPETGQRKMPDMVDREGRLRPRLPSHPDTDRDDLLRELDTRHLR